MIFAKQRPSESLVKLREILEKDIEADREEWSELVDELIPSNLKKEWGEWVKNNIAQLLSEGIEKQSEVLILLFLSYIDENNTPSSSEQNEDDASRKYGQVQIRDGQTQFSLDVSNNCNGKCVVTGCCVASRLQAAHISPHKENINYSVSNGLLLRADIHLMLDKGDCAIDPIKKTIHFKPSIIIVDSDLKDLDGNIIDGFKTDIDWSGFEDSWHTYNEKLK